MPGPRIPLLNESVAEGEAAELLASSHVGGRLLNIFRCLAQHPKLLKRYEVKKDKPAIRVLDCEGEVVAGFDTCVNARDVYKAMLDSVKLSKLKVKLANSQQESRSLLQDLRQLQDAHSQ